MALKKTVVFLGLAFLVCTVLALTGCGENKQAEKIEDFVKKQMSSSTQLPSGYKTYENASYSVKIQYPGDWKAEEGTQPGMIADIMAPATAAQKGMVSLVEASVPADGTLATFVNTAAEKAKGLDPNVSISNTTLAGGPAQQLTYNVEDKKALQIFTLHNNKIYYLSYLASQADFPLISKTFDKMTGSFAFTK